MTGVNLEYAANDARGWAAALAIQGIDLRPNAHLKVRDEGAEYAEEPSLEEAADVYISLMVSLENFGWSNGDLALAVFSKMLVNRQRQWAQGPDGTYQHV